MPYATMLVCVFPRHVLSIEFTRNTDSQYINLSTLKFVVQQNASRDLLWFPVLGRALD